MHKWFIGLGILFGSLLGVLYTGSFVSAASVYDDTVKTTQEFNIYSVDPLDVNDVRSMGPDWATESIEAYRRRCEDFNQTASCTGYTELDERLGNPDYDWAVFVREDENGQVGWYIFTAPVGTVTSEFVTISGEQYLQFTGSVRQYGFFNRSPGSERASQNSDANVLNSSVNTRNNFLYSHTGSNLGDVRILLSTFQINYPAGYEGEEISDVYTPPETYRPRIEIVTVIDWKISLKDNNFVTLEEYPFTCNEGKMPLIQYELYNTNNATPGNELDTGTYAANELYEFQAEDYGVETEFVFLARYTCGSGAGEQTFTTITTKYIRVSESGFYLLPTDDCFSDSFPFVDINGCMNVIKGVLGNLSFGAIQFADWSINTGECHTLGTIGNWLNIPSHSRTICPKFSAEVRNIVTPFLTFVLGITIMGALVTKSRHDTH